jgi:hypothetical protein
MGPILPAATSIVTIYYYYYYYYTDVDVLLWMEFLAA